MSPARPWTPHLRAALIGLALLAHGIYALPLPQRLTAKDLATEPAQRDLHVWQTGLASVGIDWTPEELGVFAMSWSERLATVHRTLKSPFKPVFDLVGANQAWALFASATTAPERLVVEIRRDGHKEWEPILRRLDPCCGWRESALEYRRVRGVWDSQDAGQTRPAYKGFTKWVARLAFEDYPDAERVRVWMEVARSVYPWEPPDPTLKRSHERVHRRSDIYPTEAKQ